MRVAILYLLSIYQRCCSGHYKVVQKKKLTQTTDYRPALIVSRRSSR